MLCRLLPTASEEGAFPPSLKIHFYFLLPFPSNYSTVPSQATTKHALMKSFHKFKLMLPGKVLNTTAPRDPHQSCHDEGSQTLTISSKREQQHNNILRTKNS